MVAQRLGGCPGAGEAPMLVAQNGPAQIAQNGFLTTLRAKGTLISEPRFSTPRNMRRRENGHFQGFASKWPFSWGTKSGLAS